MKNILLTLALTFGTLASAQTIVDVAVENDFTTLVTAVQAAELVDVLSGEGTFTVFAPTDEAFAALPEGTLEALLEDPAALAEVLTYHVVAGEVTADTVVTLGSAETVQGESVTITVGDGVMVNDANVVATDVQASNGVVHVIDRVILPPSMTAGSVDRIEYEVGSMNDSGVSGHVTLNRDGDQTTVTIALDGTPAGGNHPAHFHTGDCNMPGPVAIPLNNVNGDTGRSVTVVDAPLDAILTGNHLLMVHLSPEDLSFVACGEVAAGAPAH